MVKGNDKSLNQIRRAAIDILQAGNYLEYGHKARALDNIDNTIGSLRTLLKLMKNDNSNKRCNHRR